MKLFIEEYGLSILIAIVSAVLIIMATPLGSYVREETWKTLSNFETQEAKTVTLVFSAGGGKFSDGTNLKSIDIPKNTNLIWNEDEGKYQIIDSEGQIAKDDEGNEYVIPIPTTNESLINPQFRFYRTVEEGEIKGSNRVWLTENRQFYAMWSGQAAQQTVVDKKGLYKGAVIHWQNYNWIVLKADDSGVTLITEKVLAPDPANSSRLSEDDHVVNGGVQYCSTNCSNYTNSTLKNAIESMGIYGDQVTVSIGNESDENANGKSMVRIYAPSREEIRKYFDSDGRRIGQNGTIAYPYWLRTSGSENGKACAVLETGVVLCDRNMNERLGVRPMLQISYSNLTGFEIIE